jgi:hypothetical protein
MGTMLVCIRQNDWKLIAVTTAHAAISSEASTRPNPPAPIARGHRRFNNRPPMTAAA